MGPGRSLRIVCVADTHLGFDFPLRPRIVRRRRGPDFLENYRRVLRYAIRMRADLVVHGGDLFFRSRVPESIVDLAYEPLVEVANRGIPIVLVPGNHERSRLPASLLLGHPRIHVFDRPRSFRLSSSGVEVAIAGFPFERGDVRSRFARLLERTRWRAIPADVRLLCFHQAVEGAQVGPSDYTFRRGRDVVRMDDLPGEFHAVVAGHIHRRQILQKERPDGSLLPVVYPGSVERTSFAERDEPKGFYDLRLRRARSHWEIDRVRFETLPTLPMVDLHLDARIAAGDLEARLRAAAKDLGANAVVRLRSREPIPEEVRARLTAEFLRSVFPSGMNVQCARELAPDAPGDPS